jgi:hypothetical protein
MAPAVDEITPAAPTSPSHREGVSMWIWDDEDRIGIPRSGVESVGTTWDSSRRAMMNIGLGDGRVAMLRAEVPPHPVTGADGRPRIFGAGPLRFECVEPFARWRLCFDGTVPLRNLTEQLAGDPPPVDDAQRLVVELDIDAVMAAPPWAQGSLDPHGRFVPGEHRFEQLFRATGTVRIDGETRPFVGGGLRVHRTGGNRGAFDDWSGHCWQSALFPSGRAFGFIHYRARPDGPVRYHEGWLLDGDDVLPAKVIDTPWLTATQASGEDVSFTLRTPNREVRISCETFVSAFRPPRHLADGRIAPTLQSGITRCRWDDEPGHGMIERSAYL